LPNFLVTDPDGSMPVISYLATDTDSEAVPSFSDLHNLPP